MHSLAAQRVALCGERCSASNLARWLFISARRSAIVTGLIALVSKIPAIVLTGDTRSEAIEPIAKHDVGFIGRVPLQRRTLKRAEAPVHAAWLR
jgi:hypothetical protein